MANTENKMVATNEQRFQEMVEKTFSQNIGVANIASFHRQILQNYFVAIDATLKKAEQDRITRNANNKNKQYNNDLPYTWNNVNLEALIPDVVHYAKMGLDMLEKNHLFPIPFKNKRKDKYDITLMVGYGGIQYVAEKYALVKPKAVTIELVYSKDKFKPIKKSRGNDVESYEFEIGDAFERGELVGGFGYIEYPMPAQNKLIIMSKKDIEKRRPKNASAQFWGGKDKRYENGKMVEVESEGWYEEMCLKTLKREVYSEKNIPRDPQKIDADYRYMKLQELVNAERERDAMIEGEFTVISVNEPEEEKSVEENLPKKSAHKMIAKKAETTPVEIPVAMEGENSKEPAPIPIATQTDEEREPVSIPVANYGPAIAVKGNEAIIFDGPFNDLFDGLTDDDVPDPGF